MDSSSSSTTTRMFLPRSALLENPQRKKSYENLDRFIPNRSAMDMDFAHYMLTEGRKAKENPPSQSLYQKLLAEAFNMNGRRILAFKNKPPTLVDPIPLFSSSSVHSSKPVKPQRHIPQRPEMTLDAPDIMDDFYLNLLDWGNNNVLAIALGTTVYLWNASNSSISEVVTVDEEDGPVTSINWAPDGRHLAVGLDNSNVQLWDSTTNQMEVCGLKWSASGQQLASGGNDNLLFIWDRFMASSNSPRHWLHKLEDHTAAVKALSWCPFQSNLLASGGGGNDRHIKFWNTQTGTCLNSVDTGSQVSALQWNKHERELLSSHGFTENQLILWKYPSMVKTAELSGHTSPVLFMTQSPDGYTVASAAGDETLRFWNVFGNPKAAKPAPKANAEPFANVSHFR
uniref:CDC20/Fizzy WD40 domain-containing protein n=1 Tax=Populus alba TaxID=43335 RepID=A0A4U5NMU6_POPAL|nr:hypothetical protein D5086_0000260060 [Populus alba]